MAKTKRAPRAPKQSEINTAEETAKMAGTPDQTTPKWLEIAVGMDDSERPGMPVLFATNIEPTKRKRISSKLPADINGGRLLLPLGTSKEQVLASLEVLKKEIDKWWGMFCTHPDEITAMIYNIRTEEYDLEKSNPPPTVVDEDPGTWPKDRFMEAIEAVKCAAFIPFLVTPASKHETDIKRFYERKPGMAFDAIMLARHFIRTMNEKRASKAVRHG